MQFTTEQEAIFTHLQSTPSPLIIDAKAGSGKTSTLLESLPLLTGTTTFQAFNKSIATEIQAKVNRNLPFEKALSISVSTVHSHGLGAFRRSGRKPNIQGSKVNFLVKDFLKNRTSTDPLHKNSYQVSRLVGFAKAAGLGLTSIYEPFGTIEDPYAWLSLIDHYNMEQDLTADLSAESLVAIAQKILTLSNSTTNTVDFDDMIYLPLLLNLTIPTYDNVLLDEAQDINNTRRELAFRSISPEGRIVAVGDPNQAIYGFTGASVDSLAQIQQRAKALSLPLTICWRCDEDIIKLAQHYVPTIRARPSASQGTVTYLTWTRDTPFLTRPQPGDAILCRLNKPNVAVALGLLQRGVRAKIEGRDLGARLLTHVRKACSQQHESTPLEDMEDLLTVYMDNEEAKLLAKDKPASAADLLRDEVDAAILIISRAIDLDKWAANWQSVERVVAELFGDDIPPTGIVTLSSIHKSKGREWPTVYILGFNDYMPFPRAEMPWELEQEANLTYVAITRAEKNLVLVNGVRDAIDGGLHRG